MFYLVFYTHFWIKCRIPGTRSTYYPVNFSREHVGQVTGRHIGQVTGEHVGRGTGEHVGKISVELIR